MVRNACRGVEHAGDGVPEARGGWRFSVLRGERGVGLYILLGQVDGRATPYGPPHDDDLFGRPLHPIRRDDPLVNLFHSLAHRVFVGPTRKYAVSRILHRDNMATYEFHHS